MPTSGKSTVIPGLRYTDAAAAIDWLCRAIGFSKHLVVPLEDGSIAHAQLVLGDGMIMLGTARDDAHGQMVKPPGADGVNTSAVCLVVDDPVAVHDRVAAAGGEIVSPLEHPEYGGVYFACRDPEGHVWSIGSYDPWQD